MALLWDTCRCLQWLLVISPSIGPAVIAMGRVIHSRSKLFMFAHRRNQRLSECSKRIGECLPYTFITKPSMKLYICKNLEAAKWKPEDAVWGSFSAIWEQICIYILNCALFFIALLLTKEIRHSTYNHHISNRYEGNTKNPRFDQLKWSLTDTVLVVQFQIAASRCQYKSTTSLHEVSATFVKSPPNWFCSVCLLNFSVCLQETLACSM